MGSREATPQQVPHLLDGDVVLDGTEPPDVYRGYPGVPSEADLGYELVGPTRDDRLSGGVSGRVVIISSLWTALGIATRPGSKIYRIDPRLASRSVILRRVAHLISLGLSIPCSERHRYCPSPPDVWDLG